MKKKALILGIGGQDGSYLAEILLEKGYQVHGLLRRTALGNTKNISHLKHCLILHYGDLTDSVSLNHIIKSVHPAEIYNEADQDHAGISFKIPAYNYDVTGAAVGRLLEIVKTVDPEIKVFQPVSSNIFGKSKVTPQDETTPLSPQNPYACAKAFAYHLAKMYREVYGMFVSVGIFFNHESPRRNEEYVTRKITKAVARIKAGKQEKLVLGDISAKIDWGYAKEFMEAAFAIMQLNHPDDFVIGTGEVHSVKEFADEAFFMAGLNPNKHIQSSKAFFRASQNSVLCADFQKAKEAFGFNPKVRFKKIVEIMVKNDLKEIGIFESPLNEI